jgi:hypothetical protein
MFLNGPCNTNRCDRHRALRGVSLWTLFNVALSTACGIWFAGAVGASILDRKAEEHITTNHKIYTREDYVGVRVINGVGGVGDPVVGQYPFYCPTWSPCPIGTWTVVLHRSGHVNVIGNRANAAREFMIVSDVCETIGRWHISIYIVRSTRRELLAVDDGRQIALESTDLTRPYAVLSRSGIEVHGDAYVDPFWDEVLAAHGCDAKEEHP